MEKFSAEWVRVWLRDRDNSKLHSWSNILTLTFGFVDFETSEYVFFGIREVKKDPGLYKLYKKLQKQKEPSPMLQGWLRAISQNR
jgi:hypothetical protein